MLTDYRNISYRNISFRENLLSHQKPSCELCDCIEIWCRCAFRNLSPQRMARRRGLQVELHISFFVSETRSSCLLIYKCLLGRAPVYLSRFCVPTASVSGCSRLRSANDNQFFVPKTHTTTFGPRAFSTSGPDAWNTLSSELRHSSVSLDCFKCSLRTFLFSS